MKKLLATAFLTAAALSASAQTVVNLGPLVRCPSSVMCPTIPNDGGLEISILTGASYAYIYVTDAYGVQNLYTAGPPINWGSLVATDANGRQILASVAWYRWTICGGSGRGGGYCHPQLELLSGTLSFY